MGSIIGNCLVFVPLLAIFSLLAYAFKLGVQAAKQARQTHGTEALTFGFLAIHLCEPLVNAFLIPMIAITTDDESLVRWTFAITVPMAVLLIPSAGLFFADWKHQERSLAMLWRGLLRWLLTISIYLSTYSLWGLFGFTLFIVGCCVLWECAQWGKQMLDEARPYPTNSTTLLAAASTEFNTHVNQSGMVDQRR